MPNTRLSAARHVHVDYGVSMSLDDGTRLISDIYHPPFEGPHPVLLMRQPYGREIASTVVYAQPEYFARAGFLVVIQDVRGRGDSDGHFFAFRNEAADGCASIEWAAALPNSDGRVCMYGFSYQAYTQLAVLATPPKALVAIAPHMAAAELYSGWFYNNGMLRLATTVSWANQMLREDAWRLGAEESAAALENSYTSNTLVRQLPLAATDPITRADLPGYARDWLAHSSYDEHWSALDCSQALATAKIPVFHLGGLYDYYIRGTVDAYTCREDASSDFFLLAPWKHIPWEDNMLGLDLGPEGRPDTDALFVEWLNSQLGRNTQRFTGVRYFTMGSNTWQNAETWPPPCEKLELFLHSGGHANSRFGDGALSPEKPGEQASDHFVYDPEVPVLAPGGMNPAWGPIDLSKQQQDNNMLVFDGDPVQDEVCLAGEPMLTIHVDSSVEASAFVARLSWLRPDGSARYLSLAASKYDSDGRLETSHSVCHSVCLQLKFDPIALTLSPGDALRLDIASSAFPLLARHPNTRTPAERINNPSEFRRARQTVFHDHAHPSQLTLPIARH